MGHTAIIGALTLLGLVGLVLWIWLIVRVGRSSIIGAVLTFLFIPVSLYFLVKYWDDEELNIRAPFFGNLCFFAVALLLAFLLATQIAKLGITLSSEQRAQQREVTASKSDPSMERWCREQNDAVYSPDLGTCVERTEGQSKSETAQTGDVFLRLERHFAENGLSVKVVEFDEKDSFAGALLGAMLTAHPNVVRTKMFEFQSDGPSSPLVVIFECRSAKGCTELADEAKSYYESKRKPTFAASNDILMFMDHADDSHSEISRARSTFGHFSVR